MTLYCGVFDKLTKDTYHSAMEYLGKACKNQTEEQPHRTFLNLVLKEKLCKAARFICDREKGGVLQPEKLAEDCTGIIHKTVALVFEGKHLSKTIPSCATL